MKMLIFRGNHQFVRKSVRLLQKEGVMRNLINSQPAGSKSRKISSYVKLSAAALPLLLFLFVSVALSGALKWHSFNEGMAKALAEGKPVIVDFYADWCSWCKVMDKETFSNREVSAIMSGKFILVRIDVEGDQKIRYKNRDFTPKQFQMYMQVTGLPTVAFFDKKGELVTLLPGYIPAGDFKPVLGYIASECYEKKVTYKEYVESHGKCAKK